MDSREAPLPRTAAAGRSPRQVDTAPEPPGPDAVATAVQAPQGTRPARRAGGRFATMLLFATASFVSSGLLFLIQPMVGKLVLPLFGGAPAVWNTVMLFFQALLLAGYAYAHLSVRWLGVARQLKVHLVVLLLPVVALPVALPGWARPPTGVAPPLWLLAVLAVVVGAPFLLVSTSAPLLQRWFAATDHPLAGDPYFLYAAGNAGSLLGLLGYPLVVEPRASLAGQGRAWSVGYLLLVGLLFACVLATRRRFSPAPTPAPGPLPTGPSTRQGRDSDAARGPLPLELGTRQGRDSDAAQGRDIEPARMIWWVGLAFIPSSLMLGVTSFISTDIAAFPLLWVVPLALYLGTFIVAFGPQVPRLALAARWALPPLLVLVALQMMELVTMPTGLAILAHLLLFTAIALVAHGRLAADRPAAERLTLFYLLISIGGALGGLYNALFAPVFFQNVFEYPLVIGAAAFLLIGLPFGAAVLPPAWAEWRQRLSGSTLVWEDWRDPLTTIALLVLALITPALLALIAMGIGTRGWLGPLLVVVVTIVATVAAVRRTLPFALGAAAVFVAVLFSVHGLDLPDCLGVIRDPRSGRPCEELLTHRSFFGVQRVARNPYELHVLTNGTTVHGWQDRRAGRRQAPQSYYHADGPAGSIFEAYGRGPLAQHVGVVGLGAGTWAAYGRPGQRFTFHEIDQSNVDLAQNSNLFSYLNDSRADIEIVLGDGRLTLADQPDDSYGILFLDAFSSDAIPVHLVTSEAISLYRQKLMPGGLMVFHISSRHIDLRPVLAGIAQQQGLVGLIRTDPEDLTIGKAASRYVVLAESAADLAPLATDSRWRALPPSGGLVWTDDFSDILSVLSLR